MKQGRKVGDSDKSEQEETTPRKGQFVTTAAPGKPIRFYLMLAGVGSSSSSAGGRCAHLLLSRSVALDFPREDRKASGDRSFSVDRFQIPTFPAAAELLQFFDNIVK